MKVSDNMNKNTLNIMVNSISDVIMLHTIIYEYCMKNDISEFDYDEIVTHLIYLH